MDYVGKQEFQGAMCVNILIMKKLKKKMFKGVHFKHRHRNKGVPTSKDSIMGNTFILFQKMSMPGCLSEVPI